MSNAGHYYYPNFISQKQKQQILDWLKTIYPIWEQRYSEHNPPPAGASQRWLLRPVYWLGNWQFACLNYYHPPKGIHFRCVKAEPYPEVLQKIVDKIQEMVRESFLEKDVPRDWHLNTCLINYYGSKKVDGQNIDAARVGEHKDFEPGPVASVSFGEKALIQFVRSQSRDSKSQVVMQQWLEDCSLEIFGGDRFKKHLFHRVQRVEDKGHHNFDINVEDYKTRRINFTFRYVPTDHIQPLNRFPAELKNDIDPYVLQLAQRSEHFRIAAQQVQSTV
jgi:DNA oxidative demethylase